jgi:Mor family transcriptional regulator
MRNEKKGVRKLNEKQVKDIRMNIKKNNNVAELADKYEVSLATIYNIKHRQTWKHI